MMTNHVCAQCEANARTNESAGHAVLAATCRAYCLRGHLSLEEYQLHARARDYAHSRLVSLGRATVEWTDDKIEEALALAFRAGHGAGHNDAMSKVRSVVRR